jgi:PilZ domain
LIVQGRGTTRLRYRFTNVKDARAHLHESGGRSLFFIPNEKLRFLPDAPVCVAFSFETGDVPRLLHGRAAGSVEGSGTWIELEDTRPLRDLAAEAARRSVRTGCDAPVEIRSEHRIGCGHMVDLSAGGARLAGVGGFGAGDRIELRLLSADGLTFHDLSYARVVWAGGGQIGVEFDRSDIVGRHAVTRFIAANDELWARSWEVLHPPSGCDDECEVHPPPPHRDQRAIAGRS